MIPDEYKNLKGYLTTYSQSELQLAIAIIELMKRENIGGGGGGGGGAGNASAANQLLEIAALGNIADLSASSDIGSFSLISLLKRINVYLSKYLIDTDTNRLLTETTVSNFPATQPVSGSVSVSNFPTVQQIVGTVGVGNFPASQTVSGSVSVSNFPATQAVSGSVNIGNSPTATCQKISAFQTVQNLNFKAGLVPIGGTVILRTTSYGITRVYFENLTASVRYAQIFNQITAPTAGQSTNLIDSLKLKENDVTIYGDNYFNIGGFTYNTGQVLAISTARDTFVPSGVANEIYYNIAGNN